MNRLKSNAFSAHVNREKQNLHKQENVFPPFCLNRELKQRRRRGRRLVKNEFTFSKRNWQMFRSVQYANGSKKSLRLNMQRQCTVLLVRDRIYSLLNSHDDAVKASHCVNII